MIDSVGQLWEKIAELDEQARLLRVESNSIVGYIPGPDGSPQQIVTNEERFQQIGKGFEEIAKQKAEIEAKLAAIKDLLGRNTDGSLSRLGGQEVLLASRRLRGEMKIQFTKMFGYNGPYPLPSEIMAKDEYKALVDKIEPEIRRLEAQAASDRLLAEKAMAIIMTQ